MEKNYKINKQSKAIIEGLGYDVVLSEDENTNDIQSVFGISKKGTSEYEWIPHITKRIVYDDCETDRLMGLEGVKTDCYIAGENEIRLEVYGDTIIVNKDFSITIYYNHRNNGNMSIEVESLIDDAKWNKISIEFDAHSFSDNSPEIEVKRNQEWVDSIVIDDEDYTKWIAGKDSYSIDDFDRDLVAQKIINIVTGNRTHWDGYLTRAMEIIRPALKVYAVEFLRSWSLYIKSLINNVKDDTDGYKDTILELQGYIHENDILIEKLNAANRAIQQKARNASRRK